MNQPWNNTQASSSKPANPKFQNFLETLRNSQSGARPDSFLGANPFTEINRQKEIEKARVAQFQTARLREWEHVYSAKDKKVQQQIEQIREELQKLAKKIVKYDQNVTKAIQSEVVNPGTYHLAFFEHLKEVIAVINKNVSEANSWLSVFKKRSQSKGTFWTNAQKGGSAYLFSSEHNISRSVG